MEKKEYFVSGVAAFAKRIRFDELGSHKQCPEFHAKMQMIFDFLGELSTLVVTSKCATLKGESERFAGRSVPRGADNFLAHRRG